MRFFSRRRREPDEPSAYRRGLLNGVLLFAWLISVVVYVSSLWVSFYQTELEPPKTIGSPLRMAAANGDAVFLMTSQYEMRVVGGGSRWNTVRGFEKVMHVDLWRFDASTMQPAWRKRLLTEDNSNSLELGFMGADGDRLWIFLRQPMVYSAANGDVLANAAAIEARNASLRGVLPRQMNHYRFDGGHGFVFTAADARAWLLDAQTLTALPWQPASAKPRAGAIAPAYFVPTSLTSFQKRGLLLPKQWLGVLTDEEAAALKPPVDVPGQRRGAYDTFKEYNRAPPDLSHAGPKRYRLWRSKVEMISAAPAGWSRDLPDNWGLRPYFSNFSAFEKSPEFLQAGLLSDGRSNLPILLKEPDSVLVLHRDRIDEDGRLQVTRIAGPDGRVLWDAALPLSLVQSVIPGTDAVLLFGRGYVQPRQINRDPYHTAHEWLISLDTAKGAVRAFNLSEADVEKPRK